jgi:phosphotriesterase-related protein
LNRVLLSHDAVYFVVDQPESGYDIGFMRLFDELLPALKKSGFSEGEIEQLMLKNPRKAFAVKIRKTN